jgi:hypothetical protein
MDTYEEVIPRPAASNTIGREPRDQVDLLHILLHLLCAMEKEPIRLGILHRRADYFMLNPARNLRFLCIPKLATCD